MGRRAGGELERRVERVLRQPCEPSGSDPDAARHALVHQLLNPPATDEERDLAALRRWPLPAVYSELLHWERNAETGTLQRSSRRRRGTGTYYTPPPLVELLLDATLDPLLDRAASAPEPEAALLSLRILDPACGAGAFLVPAAERLAKRLAEARLPQNPADSFTDALRDVLTHCIHGRDLDPLALAICAAQLQGLASTAAGGLALGLRQEDGLFPSQPEVQVDAVLGNPPFVNGVEGGMPPEYRSRLRKTYPEVRGAADLACFFLAAALRQLRPEGRIGLVLPRAVLSAAPAASLRRRCQESIRPNLLFLPESGSLFPGARVFVCALGLGPDPRCRVSAGITPTEAFWREGELAGENWWQSAQGILMERASQTGPSPPPRLGDLFEVRASMTAAEAYQAVPYLTDAAEGEGPALVTTGLIQPGECQWGTVGCRYLGRIYRHPRLLADPGMPSGLAQRLQRAARPKVLVAGLSRTVECFLDAEGRCAGAVSTYTVQHPQDDLEALRRVLEWLSSEEVSTAFQSVLGGTALGGGNVTMRKSFLRELPLPPELASHVSPP